MPLLAQLVVEYVADTSKLVSGVQAAGKAQSDMTSKANQGASALLGFAAGAAAVATTAIVGIGVASTKMAADFQQGVTGLETSGNELHSNLQMVSDGMLDLAVKTGTTTTELTSGMLQIESAGYHGADGLNVLKNAAEGAKTGQSSLKDVSNGLTTAMVDYHEPVNKAAEVTNDLIATMKNGKTTMGQLAASLKNVLPFASSAGISLGDVSGAMATLTGHGLTAGQSATYLKTMILSLEAPSSKGAAVLQSIGLSAQDVATKMKQSLPDALTMITTQLKTKFPEGSAAYTAALKDIAGGSSSLAAILGLTGDNMTTFKGDVDNIAGSVKSGGDSIQGWATTQQDFNFQMDKAREVVETMGIKLGTALLPKVGELLSKIMPVITQFGNWLISSHFLENAFDVLSNAIGGTITVISNIVTFFQHNQAAFEGLKIAAILLAGVFAGALVGAMILATIAAWNMAIAFLANPIVWIAIAIGAAIALIVIAIMHWGQIVAWLSGIWGAFSGWFMGILGAIGAFFVGLWQNLANWFTGMWTGIITGLTAAWNFILNIVRAAGALLLTIILGPIVLIANAFIWLYNHNTYFKMLVDAIVNFFKGCIAWIQSAWSAVIGWLGGVWNGLLSFAGALWGQISGAIRIGFFAAIAFVQAIWGQISTVFSNAWNTYIAGPLGAMWTAVSGFFSGVWTNYIAGPIGSLWTNISTTIGGWVTSAVNWGANLIQGFVNGIISKANSVAGAVGGIAGQVLAFLGFHSPTKLGPGREADEWAPNFVKMYAKGLNDGLPQIEDAVSNFMKPIAFNIKSANPVKAVSSVGAPTSLGANTNSAPLQGGNSEKQEIHIHNYHYLDGKDITDNVQTRVVKAGRKGPIR